MTESTVDEQALIAAGSRLLEDYFFGLDSRDFDAAVATFTDDVQCSYGGIALPAGREAVLSYLRGALGDVLSTRHLATSIGVLDASTLRVCSHAIAYVVVSAGSSNANDASLQIRGLRYTDTLDRTGGRWLVRERVHEVEWAGTLEAQLISGRTDTLVSSGLKASGE